MDTLKKLFPLSFKEKKDVGALIVNILIYLAISVVVGMLAFIPIVGWASQLIHLYLLAGILLSILDYCKVI